MVLQQLLVRGVAVVVVELEDVTDPRHPMACFVDPLPERAVVDEHFGVSVVDEERQLGPEVPEVDIGGHRAQLRLPPPRR